MSAQTKPRKRAATPNKTVAAPRIVEAAPPKPEPGPSARGVRFGSEEYQNWQTRISQTIKGEERSALRHELRGVLNEWLDYATLEELYFVKEAITSGQSAWSYSEWQLVGGILDALPQSLFADKWPEEKDDWKPRMERILEKFTVDKPAATPAA